MQSISCSILRKTNLGRVGVLDLLLLLSGLLCLGSLSLGHFCVGGRIYNQKNKIRGRMEGGMEMRYTMKIIDIQAGRRGDG